MPKRATAKQILIACQMAFDGASNKEIAKKLGFTAATIANWRKLELWKEFDAELVEAYKQELLKMRLKK